MDLWNRRRPYHILMLVVVSWLLAGVVYLTNWAVTPCTRWVETKRLTQGNETRELTDVGNGTKLNVDTLKFMQSLYDSRLSQLDTKRTIGGNLLHRSQQLLLWAELPHMTGNQHPTICEIGFAYGFSAVAILSQHPTVQYVGFEHGHASIDEVWGIVKEYYPDRARLFRGDSSTKIKELATADSSIVCDVWIIDGDHSYRGAKKDLSAILETHHRLSRPRSLILWDDCDVGDVDVADWPTEGTHSNPSFKGPTKVFTEAVRDGLLEFKVHGEETDSRGKLVVWCLSKTLD